MFNGYIAADIAKIETQLAERRAAQNFRFRHFRSKESQILIAVVTSVLGFLVR